MKQREKIGMKKRVVHASIKDERLIKKRRNQILMGQLSYLSKRGFIVRQQGRLLERQVLALEPCMSIYVKRKMFYI